MTASGCVLQPWRSPRFALLVIDMQNEFADSGRLILEEVNKTIEKARLCKIPIVFSQHGHENPEVEEKTSVLVQWWGASGSIKKGSHSWKIMDDLSVLPDDIVLDEKRTYDAFYQTRLKSILDKENVDTVIISGVLTQFCCETTARSAFVQNYNVIFLSDGTGPEHKPTLDTISVGFGEVLTCEEMRQRFDDLFVEKNF